MKVFGHPMSMCTRKVLMTLAEKGHEAELVMVDLMKGEQKQPEYVAHQPFAVIPVLEDDGFWLYESRAIIRYLDAKLSGPSLTPSDQRERGLMEQWMSVEQSYFTPHAMKAVMEGLFAPMRGATPNQEVITKAVADAGKSLDVIEKGLEGKEFLAGSFSLADIDWAPYIECFVLAGGGDAIGSHANVAAWWKRISSRPTWQRVTANVGSGGGAIDEKGSTTTWQKLVKNYPQHP